MRLELRVPPVALVLVAMALIALAAYAFPGLNVRFAAQGELAAALVIVGFLVAVAGVIEFRRARTTVNPMTPEASSALVTGGVYRVTRNPMYLGFAVALLGWAAYAANALALLVIALFIWYMNRFQIVPEERALSARFGAAFDAYRARVRRWI